MLISRTLTGRASMGTLLQLAEKLEQRVGSIGELSNQAAIRVGRAILKDLVNVTPVDTSKAESNWQVSIAAPVVSDIPAYLEGKRGSTASASADAAIAAGEAVLARKKPGQTLYISNVTPYIAELDNGSSRQFAGNFRARAALIARKILESGL